MTGAKFEEVPPRDMRGAAQSLAGCLHVGRGKASLDAKRVEIADGIMHHRIVCQSGDRD